MKRPTPRWTLWFEKQTDANRYAISAYNGLSSNNLEGYVKPHADGGFEVELGLDSPACRTCGHAKSHLDVLLIAENSGSSVVERARLTLAHWQGSNEEPLNVPVVKLLCDGQVIA